MAKKRKRRPRRPSPEGPQAPRPDGRPDRRSHKEEARRVRETARKRARRKAAIGRAAAVVVVGLTILVVFILLTRASSPGSVSDAALRAGRAAGCDDVQTPAESAPGNQHAAAGQTVTSTQKPPTSGLHYGGQILPPSPHVYAQPVDEIFALHNLEHAYVVIYYRSQGKEALPGDVVKALAQVANAENKVILAPANDLNEGTTLALTAWNKLWECPAGVTADQARTMAQGFVDAYRGTSNAPEPLSP